jgi:formylglycine-generating enzyme required for sulfatase activity
MQKQRTQFRGLEMSLLAGYFDRSYPVGTKNPNALGIYDMSGNAAEWCYDGRFVNNILKRELLGGAWYSWVSAIQVGLVSTRNPFDMDNGFGLRIAQTP